MTQKDKELLIKVLCARLPYKTRVRYTYAFAGVAGINEYSAEGTLSYDKLQDFSLPNVGYERRRVVCILPYLRPMSSMTKDERTNLRAYCRAQEGIIYDIGVSGAVNSPAIIDYLNAHYFDYRGLIEKGLALEASEGMYNIKEK